MSKPIQLTRSRTLSWKCVLCLCEHTVSEKVFFGTDQTITYGCACGRIYRVCFKGDGSVEEDTTLDRLFTITRSSSGIEVRLAWDAHKGAWAMIERENWSQALAQAIGMCWQRYADEITERLREG